MTNYVATKFSFDKIELSAQNTANDDNGLQLLIEVVTLRGYDMGHTIENAASRAVREGDRIYVTPDMFPHLPGFRGWAQSAISEISEGAQRQWADHLAGL